jgi:signal transduction histidine kinase
MQLLKTLQSKIFLTMLILVIIVSASIIFVAIYQYKEQAEDYHKNRLERKENSVKRDIEYQLDNTTFLLETEKLPYIFREKIFEMSHVHNLEIGIYDLKGDLLISSRATFQMDSLTKPILKRILNSLNKDINHRIIDNVKYENENYFSIYSYIYDHQFNPIGILHIPYFSTSNFYQKELEELITRIGFVFLFAVLFSIILAYFSSRLISDPIKEIVEKMKATRLIKQNEKIDIYTSTIELKELIKAYNSMIDDLENSAVKLAFSERENAWREMAKQVAHEIKNPLTPMRLTIQNYERKYDAKAEDNKEKLADFCDSLIQQIDTMSTIASAFSDFAKMPIPNKELLDVVDVTKSALDIFSEDYIFFKSDKKEISASFDKTQLTRILTNLVTNALHAVTDTKNPEIEVVITETAGQIEISVKDNGKGIADENKSKIFEPKFTTKSSGMGLGLAMVKNIVESYNGKIKFESKLGLGTKFTINFPKD